jgi:hypothetical protein
VDGAAAELNTLVAPHPLAYSQDHIKAVEVDKTLYLADALGLNYPEFPDCWLGALLMVAVNGGDMLIDGWHRHPIKLG